MQQPIFCTAGETEALHHARNQLIQWGYPVFSVPAKAATHLLLPVPSFDSPGMIKGGRSLDEILPYFSPQITIFGGNLGQLPCSSVDFLKDEYYLGENAQITAQCTLSILQQQCHLKNAAVLVIGWGRIGKRLLPLLQAEGAAVTVALRKEAALLDLCSGGQDAVKIGTWCPAKYDIIINTAPAPVLDERETNPNAFLLDLASTPGIVGERVLWARGLPNRYAPEASGILIAKTALRYALGKENL